MFIWSLSLSPTPTQQKRHPPRVVQQANASQLWTRAGGCRGFNRIFEPLPFNRCSWMVAHMGMVIYISGGNPCFCMRLIPPPPPTHTRTSFLPLPLAFECDIKEMSGLRPNFRPVWGVALLLMACSLFSQLSIREDLSRRSWYSSLVVFELRHTQRNSASFV
jgi:hypothetical protein